MSGLKQYPAYKDSGVEWLGEVPEGWTAKKLGFLGEAIIGLTYSPEDVVSEGTLVLRSSNVQQGRLAFTNNVHVSKAIPEKLIVKKGDILICSRNGSRDLIGKNALIDESADGMTFGAFMTIFRSPINDFLYQVFNSSIFSAQSGSFMTSTVNQLTISNLNSFIIPVPPRQGQTQIARFLDHETARIDALIEEQQRLIELLKEKRQAVISHAVTKGLDPRVPMKDSGVEWLGEVPAHWTVTKLKFVTDQVVDCPHETPNYDPDGDYLVIRTADIDQGVLKPEQMYRLDREQYAHRTRRMCLESNDVVYSREGERWGHAALVPQSDLYALGQRMMQMRVCGSVCPEFFMYQLNSVATYRQGEVDTVGATAPHVNISTVINYYLMLPAIAEQREISQYLSMTLDGLDCLLGESLEMKALLQERRSALISAAVTGKIDVRGWQPPASTHGPETAVAEAV